MLRDGVVVADAPIPQPLVAGDAERPTMEDEIEAVLKNVYYGRKEEEYT
jgi:hypothetical protein